MGFWKTRFIGGSQVDLPAFQMPQNRLMLLRKYVVKQDSTKVDVLATTTQTYFFINIAETHIYLNTYRT